MRLDNGNVAAKFDLELAVRRLRAVGARTGRGQGSGPRGGGRRGAGAGLPGGGTEVLALELTFLTPLGALACLAAVLPLAALVLARRRAGRAPRPRSGSRAAPRFDLGRLLLLAAACCAFGLAAAQPALGRDSGRRGADGRPGGLRPRRLPLDARLLEPR